MKTIHRLVADSSWCMTLIVGPFFEIIIVGVELFLLRIACTFVQDELHLKTIKVTPVPKNLKLYRIRQVY